MRLAAMVPIARRVFIFDQVLRQRKLVVSQVVFHEMSVQIALQRDEEAFFERVKELVPRKRAASEMAYARRFFKKRRLGPFQSPRVFVFHGCKKHLRIQVVEH